MNELEFRKLNQEIVNDKYSSQTRPSDDRQQLAQTMSVKKMQPPPLELSTLNHN